MKQLDVVVIGAGSAGLTSAVGFNKAGRSVLLIEGEHMGGECTNSGCVPSKALLHAARTGMDGPTALTYVRDTINKILEEETPETFNRMGIDVVRGEAIFVGRCNVRVGETTYYFRKAVIATGSSPRRISIDGLDEQQLLTNQNLFKLKAVPPSLLIVGGGPIGMEMAEAFARLGSRVTIIERNHTFARLEDPAVQVVIRQSLEALGVTIFTEANIAHIDGQTATIAHSNNNTNVKFDKLLLAIGRVPNTPDGLAAARIDTDEQGVVVDGQFRTSNKHVYAIGDIISPLKFTHTADDQARQIVAQIVSRGLIRIRNSKPVPKVTYTSPELAQIGLHWDEAVRRYGESAVRRIEIPLTASDRAKTSDQTNGVLVVICKRLTGKVLGAHIAAPAAGELIAVFTLAIQERISLWKLQQTIFAYPTYALLIKKAADDYVGTQLRELRTDVFTLLRRSAPKLIALTFWSSIIFLFQYYRISNELTYTDMLFSLLGFFTSSVWGPIIYMVLYAVRPIVLFPATLLTALSGALFGLWWGIFYTIIGENVSANLAYWIGRFFGKDWHLEDSALGRFVSGLRENTFTTVLFMRLFYVPFDLTNYGSGVVGARWREYFFATLIGIMPGLTTFVALGASVDLATLQAQGLSYDVFNPWYLALSIGLFLISLLLVRVLRRVRLLR